MPRYAKTENETPEEKEFWAKLCACEGKTFTTYAGLPYSFTLKGNELFFSRKKKSITRATILRCYRKAKELLQSGQSVDGPKKLGLFGASYIFPILKDLGEI